MEDNEIKQRVQVGMFVTAGVALFLFAVFFIGSASNYFSRTFVVSAVFKNVEGLKEGDKVWLSGVQIGTVKMVRIMVVGEVVVSLLLKEKQNEFIRKNATASIGSDGLIGSKIVVIQPGNSTETIEDNDTIDAVSPADTQELINLAKQVGENTRGITLDLKAISGKLNNGKGILGELMNDGLMAQDLRRMVANFKATSENSAHAAANLAALAEEMRHGKGLITAMLSDTNYVATFKDVQKNVQGVSAKAALMATSLEAITAKMNDQHNAVGVVLADTAFARKMQIVMNNSVKASYKMDENMEALKHNFLTRGYFRKKAREDKKEKERLKQGKATGY